MKIQRKQKSIIVFSVIVVGYIVIASHVPIFVNDYPKYINNISEEYLSLFNFKDTSKIKIATSAVTKYRYPFSRFEYDSKYSFTVYKLTDSMPTPLTSIVTTTYNFSQNTTNTWYSAVYGDFFKLNYSVDTPRTIKEIVLNLAGDSNKNIIFSDSVIGYRLNFKNISLSIDPKKTLDFYIEPNDNLFHFKELPIIIVLKKRSQQVYLVLISGITGKEQLNDCLVLTLMNKR
jgi:hypothetical protein